MVIVECPWCDGPVALEAEAVEVRCEACLVTAELAIDVPGTVDLATAA